MSENKAKPKYFELSDLIPIYGWAKGTQRVTASPKEKMSMKDIAWKSRMDVLYVSLSSLYHFGVPMKIAQHYELAEKTYSLIEKLF